MNPNKTYFDQLKQQFLPYFIEIYGEEFREVIVKRIDAIEPIFYDTIESKKNIMNSMQQTKQIELTLKFLESNNIEIPNDIKTNIIMENHSYPLNDLDDASRLLEACFGSNQYKDISFGGIKGIVRQPTDQSFLKKQSIDSLSKFGVEIDVQKYNGWLLTDEAKQTFEKIDKLLTIINKLDAEYREFDSQFDNLKTLINKASELETNVNEKYMIEFLKSIQEYINEEDKKRLNEYLISDKKDFNALKRNTSVLKVVGDSFYNSGLIEAFSSRANTTLNDLETGPFTKQSIIDERINYYKLIGVYNGQMNPVEFLTSQEAIVNTPDQKTIDYIISKKEYYANLASEETIKLTSSYNDNLETINRLNLTTKVDFSTTDIKEGTICIQPSIRIVDANPESVSLLAFSPGSCLPQYIDTMFIHEINHAVELSLVNYEDGEPLHKCGFELLTEQEDETRDYEAFNEIINQMVAMEITEAMHRDNVYLFDNPINSKTRGGTSYENQIEIIKPFWNTFKKDIMISRTNSNLNSLFSIVGKENFELLNNTINEYTQLPYYELMDDIISGQTTELTKKRDELIDRTLYISNLMIENSKKYSEYNNISDKVL